MKRANASTCLSVFFVCVALTGFTGEVYGRGKDESRDILHIQRSVAWLSSAS